MSKKCLIHSQLHGLAGAKLIVIEGESTDRWQALLEACHREFQPETEIEIELVTEIAAARWRLRRCWSMETSLFDMEIAKQRENPQFEPQDFESQHAAAARDLGQDMRLMDRYETRMRRSYERAVDNLYQLRARRNQKFPNEPKNSGE